MVLENTGYGLKGQSLKHGRKQKLAENTMDMNRLKKSRKSDSDSLRIWEEVQDREYQDEEPRIKLKNLPWYYEDYLSK